MNDCCSSETPSQHLIIIGGGSAAFSAATTAHALGARVTLINAGLPIGGCCVNVGCVPSKTLIRAAEAHHRGSSHSFQGLEGESRVSDFAAVMRQKTELVEELRQAKYIDVVADLPNFERIEGWARLVAPDTVEVNGREIKADRILVATGDTPYIPEVPGLKDSGYLITDTAFELDTLPESMIVLGGRYIALECAQMFARFGTKVTVLQRSNRILPTESPELTDELTGYLTEEGLDVVTGVKLLRVENKNGTFSVEAEVNGKPRTFSAEQLLVATGRIPNTANMGLEETGVALDAGGFMTVDDTMQSSVPEIYGAGNCTGEPAYVYTAAYEGALATTNALTDESTERDYTALPWVVFTDPQVAGTGLDEQQAKAQGIDAEATLLPLSHVPRALAARDTRGFIQLIRDKQTDRLVGGRILAPEGGELAMEISLAIKYGITATELARAFHPYLTLSEGIKLAAITFGKDVSKLSCCAT